MSGSGLEPRVIYCKFASLVGIRSDALFSALIYLFGSQGNQVAVKVDFLHDKINLKTVTTVEQFELE